MSSSKRFVKSTKKAPQLVNFNIVRGVIIFLAMVGDMVITLYQRAFFLLKKAIFITGALLTYFVQKLPSWLNRIKINLPLQAAFKKPFTISPDKGLIFSYSSYAHSQKFKAAVSRSYFLIKTQFKLLLQTVYQKSQQYCKMFIFVTSKFLTAFCLIILKILLYRLPRIRIRLPRPKFALPHLPPFFVGLISGAMLLFIFVFIPYNIYIYLQLLPNPKLLSQRVIPVTTQIFDRNGNLLYEFYADQDRKPLPLAQIPKIVQQATVAIEDKTFYTHPGFSITGIARAARETFVNHQTQGGSTITQQLIKNALLTPEVSLQRKVRELVLAFWAERVYTKNQILEMYLNQVPYGGTAWGIAAAAQMYFGKSVAELSLSETAYLAGLPAAPTLYSPYGAQPQLAMVRQKEVLHRMLEENFITEADLQTALATPINIKPQIVNIKAPHFVMYVRQLLTKTYGAKLIDQGGLRITTTLDLNLQEKVEQIIASNITQLAKLKVGNGAALVTTSQTGDILAMVGSKNYFDEAGDGNVNVTLAPRQPGSAIKPLTYALALENGFTATSVISDTPISFNIPGQPVYAPINYDGRFHGPVTLRTALASSYNIPAVKTLSRLGVKNLLDLGKQTGITTWGDQSRFGLSLTLGGGEVTLLDMNTLYGVFANYGQKVDLNPILQISDYTGKIYYQKKPSPVQTPISPATAFIISNILSDNSARTPAFGPRSALFIPGKSVAVKTGTTNDKRDNLTFGYTPSYVVGVWVGNNDNTPMDPYLTSGITGAAPIWNQIMQELLKEKSDEPFQMPETVVSKKCFGKVEYFKTGTEPKNGCPTLPSPSPVFTKT